LYIGGDRTKCTKLYPEICEALFIYFGTLIAVSYILLLA
jgi:hypothetical protein